MLFPQPCLLDFCCWTHDGLKTEKKRLFGLRFYTVCLCKVFLELFFFAHLFLNTIFSLALQSSRSRSAWAFVWSAPSSYMVFSCKATVVRGGCSRVSISFPSSAKNAIFKLPFHLSHLNISSTVASSQRDSMPVWFSRIKPFWLRLFSDF